MLVWAFLPEGQMYRNFNLRRFYKPTVYFLFIRSLFT
jgi:hypothetical protein